MKKYILLFIIISFAVSGIAQVKIYRNKSMDSILGYGLITSPPNKSQPTIHYDTSYGFIVTRLYGKAQDLQPYHRMLNVDDNLPCLVYTSGFCITMWIDHGDCRRGRPILYMSWDGKEYDKSECGFIYVSSTYTDKCEIGNWYKEQEDFFKNIKIPEVINNDPHIVPIKSKLQP